MLIDEGNFELFDLLFVFNINLVLKFNVRKFFLVNLFNYSKERKFK